MSTRVVNVLILAVATSLVLGCTPDGRAVGDVSGFWPGIADGFLILVSFFSGQLGEPDYFDRLQAGTSYYMGYLCGAMGFFTIGTLVSLP